VGPKLSRAEIVGAWLGIWTPPRDAEVPPVPWRRIGIAALAALLVGGAALALIAPRIDRAKDERAAREQSERAARAALRRAILRAEQTPRFGRAAGDRRAEVLQGVEEAIGRDARRRFSPNARPATCEPVAGADAAAARVAFECFSSIRDIVGGEGQGAIGSLAIPFRAVVDFDRHRYAFCKVNPPPGEQILPDPRDVVELPRACRSPSL
jgi:hypothetical protein